MGTCGRCAIVPDDIPAAINTKHLCYITLDQQRCIPLYMGIIEGLRIPLPSLRPQQHFATLVERHELLLAGQREALRQADHFFQSLLHRAFAAND